MYGLRPTRVGPPIFSARGGRPSKRAPRARMQIEALEARLVLSASSTGLYLQSNLVSNIQGTAQVFDPILQDPWGFSFSKSSPFWISDQASNVNGSSVTTLYTVNATTGVPSA